MNKEWRTKSAKIFLILLLVTTLLFVLSSVFATNMTINQICKNNNIHVGETVMEGSSIEYSDIQVRYPFISNPHFIVHEITTLDLFGLIQSLSTGSVSYDYSYVVSEGLSSNGVSEVSGPGFLNVEKW